MESASGKNVIFFLNTSNISRYKVASGKEAILTAEVNSRQTADTYYKEQQPELFVPQQPL